MVWFFCFNLFIDFFIDKKINTKKRGQSWPSGLRRYVQVVVSFMRHGFESHRLHMCAWVAEGSKAGDLSSSLFGGMGSNPIPSKY